METKQNSQHARSTVMYLVVAAAGDEPAAPSCHAAQALHWVPTDWDSGRGRRATTARRMRARATPL